VNRLISVVSLGRGAACGRALSPTEAALSPIGRPPLAGAVGARAAREQPGPRPLVCLLGGTAASACRPLTVGRSAGIQLVCEQSRVGRAVCVRGRLSAGPPAEAKRLSTGARTTHIRPSTFVALLMCVRAP